MTGSHLSTGYEQQIPFSERFDYPLGHPFLGILSDSLTIQPQGNNYQREGNFTQAYLLLLRHSTLVLNHIPKHPDAKTAEGKKLVKPLGQRIERVLGQLDELKPPINEAYNEWLKISASQRDALAQLEGERSPYEKLATRDSALSWNPQVRAKILDASEYQELAVDLAKKEIRRRDAARKATRQAGISEEEEQARRGAGVWDDWDAIPAKNGRDEGDDIRQQMDAVRRRLDQTEQAGRPTSPSEHPNDSFQTRTPSYHYPSITKSGPYQYLSPIGDNRDYRSTKLPALPPKQLLSRRNIKSEASPPALPGKEPLHSPHYISPFTTEPSEQLPDLPPKAMEKSGTERYTFRPAAYLENGNPIRPIFIPNNLRREFMRMAEPNTRRGLEMCGILCGTNVNNALFISCLLIPDQICTSDTCETANENEVMEYCIQEDLLVFGWIHTHPTQTCFMSSRDLHTQAGYQVMMPESIAIVCAPRSVPS